MTMVSRICPACRATVSLDDTKEFGFCEECGAKIMLSDPASAPGGDAAAADTAPTEQTAVDAATSDMDQATLDDAAVAQTQQCAVVSPVETHTASVIAADADTAAMLAAANRAFDDRNFAEAGDKYASLLAVLPESFEALYRGAICRAYLAGPDDLDAGAFAAAMRSASDALHRTSSEQSYVDISAARDLDITNMLISMFSAGRTSEATQSCLDNCKHAYEGWLKIASFAHTAVSYIEKESYKESALSEAIDFCDLIKNKQMSYLSGMETAKDGTSKPIYEAYTPDSALAARFAKLRSELASVFNALPSRVAKSNELKLNIQNISQAVSELEEQAKAKSSELSSASKSFWAAHPEQYKERRNMRLKSLIILGVAAIIAVFVYMVKQPLYALLVFIIGGIVTASKMSRDTNKYDDKVLSFEVKLLQSDLDAINNKLSVEEAALKDKQKALAEFEKTNK